MKKRILTILAVLALLVVCTVIAVQAEDTYVDLATFKCPCSACTAARVENPDYVLPTDQWITTFTTAPVNGGHYYVNAHQYPKTQISAGAGVEAVYLLDNAWICQMGTGRAMLANGAGAKLHFVGNGGNAVLLTKSSSTQNGTIGQVSGGGEIHLYGQLVVKLHADATAVATNSGLFRMAGGKLHIHANEGLGLPNEKNPTLNAPAALANETESMGGIAYLESAANTFIVDAGTLNGTSSCYRGAVLANKGGTIIINGGTLNGGIAANRGGIIYNMSGTVTMTGGTLDCNEKMTASYRGVNIAGGTFNFAGGKIISCNKGLGDAISLTNGDLLLTGDATVENVDGAKTNNIWRWNDASNKGTIKVDEAWTGTASLHLPGAGLENHGGAFQTAILYFGTVGENYAFTDGEKTVADKCGLYLENAGHDAPQFAGYQRYLVTCRAGLYVDGKLVSWWVTPGNAITEYAKVESANKYIKLWADYKTTINTEVTLDLNGRNQTQLTLGENGKIAAFDSAAKAGEAGATINVATEALFAAPTGKIYAAKDGVIYPVEAAVTHVTLRPGTEMASMYYTATFNVPAELGLTGGVAMTLNADSKTLEDCVYTSAAVAAGEANGVLLEDIVHNGREDNKTNAAKTVYAKAYVQIGDTVVFADGVAGYSLNTLIAAVEEKAADNEYVKAMAEYDWYKSLKA